MPLVTRTARAERDLISIWQRIAQDNPDATGQMLDRIDTAAGQLAQFPQLGRPRFNLSPTLRSFVVQNYLIFYKPSETGILISRVLHGARDMPPLFE